MKTDKYNVKICVGDILATSNTEDKTIDTWGKEDFGFTVVEENGYSKWYPDNDRESVYNWNYVEIVGNINDRFNLVDK